MADHIPKDLILHSCFIISNGNGQQDIKVISVAAVYQGSLAQRAHPKSTPEDPGDCFETSTCVDSTNTFGPKRDQHVTRGCNLRRCCVFMFQKSRTQMAIAGNSRQGSATEADPVETFWKLHSQLLKFTSVSPLGQV